MPLFAPATRPAPVVPCCDACGQQALEQVLAPNDALLCPLCFGSLYGGSERHETVRLFNPAPAPMPGQMTL